jgi:hypothetical protein
MHTDYQLLAHQTTATCRRKTIDSMVAQMRQSNDNDNHDNP